MKNHFPGPQFPAGMNDGARNDRHQKLAAASDHAGGKALHVRREVDGNIPIAERLLRNLRFGNRAPTHLPASDVSKSARIETFGQSPENKCCMEIAFAPAAPWMARVGTGVGE